VPMLYVGMRASVNKTQNTRLIVGDVAQLFMEGKNTAALSDTPLGEVTPGWRAILPVELVQALSPALPEGAQIQMIGEKKCMVRGVPAKRRKRPLQWLGTVIVALLLFFGGALSLMNFHADVNMPRVHTMISKLVTGEADTGALWISIPYSLGIGLGVLFFTGLGRRRTNPNFFELEEREYQSKVDKYLQEDETGGPNDA